MDIKDLLTKNESELQRLLAEQREKLQDLRFKDSNKQLKDVREIREVKTLVARILTILNSKKETNK